MNWTSDNDGPFIDQKYVDEFFEETKELALKVESEEDAVVLLKRIKYLDYVSDEFYVPSDTGGWEEMALSYIDSPKAIFCNVHYDILSESHKIFFESIRSLEDAALQNEVLREEIFYNVKDFNDALDHTNEHCEKYGMMSFVKYWFRSSVLQNKYEKWLDLNVTIDEAKYVTDRVD